MKSETIESAHSLVLRALQIFFSHSSPGFLLPGICKASLYASSDEAFKPLCVREELVEVPTNTREFGPSGKLNAKSFVQQFLQFTFD